MLSTPPRIRRSRLHRSAGALALLLAMSCALAACGSSGATATPSVTPAASPTVASTPTATPTPRVLFQADWAHGLAGWQATSGWSVSQGVLISDGGLNRDFTIPFRPAGPDYTIELQLRVISVPQDGKGEFLLHAPATPGRDGFIAGGYHLLTHTVSTFADHPQFGITIDPPSSNASPSLAPFIDYEHGFIQHTYRIEVRGAHATFLSDNHIIVTTRSNSTPTLSTGPFQFTCKGVVLRLSALRILSA
ncbi:MAG TPA: hypothetical protein VFY89_03480 [Ktedonobacterales bacterium]